MDALSSVLKPLRGNIDCNLSQLCLFLGRRVILENELVKLDDFIIPRTNLEDSESRKNCKKKQRTEGVEQLVSKILSSTLQKSRAYIPGTSKRHLSGPYEKYAKQFRDFCRSLLDRYLVQVEVKYLVSVPLWTNVLLCYVLYAWNPRFWCT
ncbi:hypothetical protein CRM22_009806 [Opisthorchis felineus]|uniref:Uncharacterized protein n=1 Tax=Opisthorchis felineus TaxID=147828 RepID=A0A4S2L5E6_OPIFE|nr:hypothetical protein CRM22_009806 [Opisthorchis felineus]